jgi:hypothetical protein
MENALAKTELSTSGTRYAPLKLVSVETGVELIVVVEGIACCGRIPGNQYFL